jgi:hypothetical protein
MILKDECICGHERDHHFLDQADKTRHNCLAMRCDCRIFEKPDTRVKSVLRPVDRDAGPETPRTNTNKPHVDTHCNCNACFDWTIRKMRSW